MQQVLTLKGVSYSGTRLYISNEMLVEKYDYSQYFFPLNLTLKKWCYFYNHVDIGKII